MKKSVSLRAFCFAILTTWLAATSAHANPPAEGGGMCQTVYNEMWGPNGGNCSFWFKRTNSYGITSYIMSCDSASGVSNYGFSVNSSGMMFNCAQIEI